MITIVGMGRNAGDMTQNGREAIASADVVVVKSRLTHAAQAVAEIRGDAVFCDDLFETAADFDSLNASIVGRLRSFGGKKVVFCVVGDGVDDTTAQLLPESKLVCGVGLHTPVMPKCGGVRVYTAAEFCSEKYVLPVPTVVKCIDDKLVATEVQLQLLRAFDPDCPVFFTCEKNTKQILLSELCNQRFNYQSAVGIVPHPLTSRKTFGYYDAVEVLSILRAPNGCPWDKAQTHKSIAKNAIEEAYELVDALEKEDSEHVVEELGDLLMQVLFHLEIARENGEFEPESVYSGLCRKLVDRHPHVFGSVRADTAEQSLDVWDKQKLKEHKIKSTAQNVMDVPFSMSALLRGQKVQSRAAKGGYEFENISQAVEKVREELDELLSASEENKLMEGGDLLFAVINVLRLSGVDSETALIVSTQKFCRRVCECERILAERGAKLCDLNGEQFDEVWREAKKNVG